MTKRLYSVLIVYFIAVLNGCAAHKFTSPLLTNQSDAATLHGQDLNNVSVAVNPFKDNSKQWQFEKFIEELRKANIFKEVHYADQLKSKPALALTLLERKETPDFLHACSMGFEGGMITVLTLGLIPQICHQQTDIHFSISSLYNSKTIDFYLTYKEDGVLGWLAAIYNISSNWSWRYPEYKKQKLLTTVIMEQSTEIQQLLP